MDQVVILQSNFKVFVMLRNMSSSLYIYSLCNYCECEKGISVQCMQNNAVNIVQNVIYDFSERDVSQILSACVLTPTGFL